MRKYKKFPEEGELVIVKIIEVHPHSVFAKLIEYNIDGLIHISEISRTWVRNIKKYVRAGEIRVAQVLGNEGKTINLSLKRVNESQKKMVLEEWNKEKKAEKFLETLSKSTNIPLNEIYEKVAFPFQKELGTAFDGFKLALKEPEKLKSIIDEKYIAGVKEIAKKFIKLKEVKLESKISVSVFAPNGIDVIKKALKSEDKIKITYLSAPHYKIEVFAPEYKTGKEKMRAKLSEIQSVVEKSGGLFSLEN